MKKHGVTIVLIALVGLLLGTLPVGADDDENEQESVAEFEGSVEVLYRNVDVGGNQAKYDEDFDGLSSGGRITNVSLSWRDIGLSGIDYARIEALGLGGDPYEHIGFSFGAKDTYDLTFEYRNQDYLYNMFGFYGDEDGHTWDTSRSITNLKLTYFVAPKANVFVEFRDNDLSGSSLFMKDIERELFRLETPRDVNEKRYAVGTNVQAGPVDIYFRQTFRDYSNHFDNSTEGALGLDTTNLTTLDVYDWSQRERSDAYFTDLKLHSALGRRVDLTMGYFGTLFGDEELTSQVDLNASGTSFTGTCAVGGGACANDAACDAIVPGDVCVADPFSIVGGSSDTKSEVDTTLGSADLSWTIIDPVILHLEYRALDRNVTSTGEIDLSGTGTPAQVDTSLDWSIDTVTAVVEAHPLRTFTFDIGFRVADRSLDRSGYGDVRDDDYRSDGDQGVVFGLTWRPIDWFRLDGDYEDLDIDQPFTNVSLYEAERTRVRTLFTPLDGNMRIDFQYLETENTNTASDFRTVNTFFGSSLDAETWSGSFWYRPSRWVDFLLRYAQQEVETVANVIYDTAGFGATDPGVDRFDNTNQEVFFRVNFSWGDPWKAYARYWVTESDGMNPLISSAGTNVDCLPGGAGAVCNPAFNQEYSDYEVGVTYSFASGLYVGGAFRDFDYDDDNSVVDYDGTILTLLAGVTF